MSFLIVRSAPYLIIFQAFNSYVFAVTYSATLLQPASFTTTSGLAGANGSQVGSGSGTPTGGQDHALIWTGTAESYVDLHPDGFDTSRSYGASSTNQVGAATIAGLEHATLWSGTAASAVELHPTGYDRSIAFDVAGSTQVGYGHTSVWHALIWNGTASSVVDVHPVGFMQSYIFAVDGNTQVGRGDPDATGRHALLWHGTAQSVTDLHPAGFVTSYALDVSGNQQVGHGQIFDGTANRFHALLWSGSAGTAIDLHSAGFQNSTAWSISGNTQVGSGWTLGAGGTEHAHVWNGSAASAIDIHSALSGLGPNFTQSVALSAAPNGTIVGYARISSGTTYAVMWTPVPEPTAFVLFVYGVSVSLLAMSHRRRHCPYVKRTACLLGH